MQALDVLEPLRESLPLADCSRQRLACIAHSEWTMQLLANPADCERETAGLLKPQPAASSAA
jgi:hypothetical protein